MTRTIASLLAWLWLASYGISQLLGANADTSFSIAMVVVCGVLLNAWGAYTLYTGLVAAYGQFDEDRDRDER